MCGNDEKHLEPSEGLLTCGRAQSVLDETGSSVKEGAQVKGWHVESFHSMISDIGVSVEALPRVHVELPISSIQHMGDVASLESPLVFGCIPTEEKVQMSVQI